MKIISNELLDKLTVNAAKLSGDLSDLLDMAVAENVSKQLTASIFMVYRKSCVLFGDMFDALASDEKK